MKHGGDLLLQRRLREQVAPPAVFYSLDPSRRRLSGAIGRLLIPKLMKRYQTEDERELESELARLQQEHRDLDAAIDALHQSPAPDLLRLQRLKKRKLQLRDRIAFIEDQITPDIIA